MKADHFDWLSIGRRAADRHEVHKREMAAWMRGDSRVSQSDLELLCPACAVSEHRQVLEFSYGLLLYYCPVHGRQITEQKALDR